MHGLHDSGAAVAVARRVFSMPARMRGRASNRQCSVALVLLACCVSACGSVRTTSEDRLAREWTGVQVQFDRLAAFELEFRAAAAAAASRTDSERIRFVRDALDRRARLQLDLKRELKRFTAATASEPHAARVQYARKLQLEMAKLRAVVEGTVPAVKALALGKYDDELTAYQAQKDTELRDGR